MKKRPPRDKDGVEILSPIDDYLLKVASEQERKQLASDLERLIGGQSFREWIAEKFPHEPPPDHLSPVIDALEIARLQPIRLCISMPPGHSKTTTLLRGIVWWLLKSPADQ